MNIWAHLIENNLNSLYKDKSKKKEQNNISKEAITDVLDDNPDEVPDDVDDSGGNEEQGMDMGGGDDFGGDDFGGDGGGMDDMDMDAGGGDDMGGDMGEEPEPPKVKKNEFSAVNNKIYIIERYDRLLDTAVKTQELFKKIPELRDQMGNELAQLIDMIEDEKNSVALYSKAENNIRYRLYFEKVNRFISKIVKNNE